MMKTKINKEQIKKTFLEIILMGFFTIGLICLIIGPFVFMAGYKNLDLSWNVLRLAYFENFNYELYADKYNLNGDFMDYDAFYTLGVHQMFLGLAITFAGGMLMGFFIGNIPKLKELQDNDIKFRRR